MDAVNYWVWLYYAACAYFTAYFVINLSKAILKTSFSNAESEMK